MAGAPVFRKTEAGQAEVRERRLGLDAHTRALLIQVNGQLGAAALAERLGCDPGQALQRLLQAGLVAPAAATRGPAAAPAAPAPSAPPPPPETPPAPIPDQAATVHRAVQLLAPVYGPDAVQVVQPLLAARGLPAWEQALAELQHKLSVPLGRKRAADLVQQLRAPG